MVDMSERSSNTTKIETLTLCQYTFSKSVSERSSNTTKIETDTELNTRMRARVRKKF